MVSNYTLGLSLDECLKLQDKSRRLQITHAVLETASLALAIAIAFTVAAVTRTIANHVAEFTGSVRGCGVRIRRASSGESHRNHERCSFTPPLGRIHVLPSALSPPEYTTSATVGDYYGGSASEPAQDGRCQETLL